MDTHDFCVYSGIMSSPWVAYVDGGSRGSRGPAGIGVVIEHPGGRRVEISETIEAGDNNYAEYSALLAALEYAAENQCTRLCVFSDSEVVVKQITGHYTCQSAGLRSIHEMCKELIQALDEFTILHIRRQANSEADRLANEAMDRTRKLKTQVDAAMVPAPA
ncbi:MAG TPA: ribonuclease HI family protein [Terriglobales bacterium]|nr:ribonuclease HI family protein [Terriglobales bacterium]